MKLLSEHKTLHDNLALISREEEGAAEPFVIAHGYDRSDNTWSQGEYFRSLEKAQIRFRELVRKRVITERLGTAANALASIDFDLGVSDTDGFAIARIIDQINELGERLI